MLLVRGETWRTATGKVATGGGGGGGARVAGRRRRWGDQLCSGEVRDDKRGNNKGSLGNTLICGL